MIHISTSAYCFCDSSFDPSVDLKALVAMANVPACAIGGHCALKTSCCASRSRYWTLMSGNSSIYWYAKVVPPGPQVDRIVSVVSDSNHGYI